MRRLNLSAVAVGLVSACTPVPDEPWGHTPVAPTAPVEKPVAARPPVDLPPIDDDPKQLLGLDSGALTQLLGAPRFVRRDAPAQLWRYRDGDCILDLFLYGEAGEKGANATVRHFEARSLSKANTTARECLNALLTQRQRRGAG